MNNNQTERQNVAEKYKNLSASDRIVFKSILDLAVILLKGSQEQKGA